MKVSRCWNPLVLDADYEVVAVSDERPLSIREIIEAEKLRFDRPVMCMVDGQFWGRADWSHPVPTDSVVRFVELPRGGDSNALQVVAQVALIGASIFLPPLLGLEGLAAAALSAGIMMGGSLLMGMLFRPALPSVDTSQPASMHSLAAGGNRLRLGEPYVEQFGRCHVFPDLAQGAYTSIIENEQYLYVLGIIGVGEYDIEGIYIDKTPFGDYADAAVNVLGPGVLPVLVPNVVWTAAGAGGQTLSTEWLTLAANPAGTSALHIEYDVVFTGGLCAYNKKGKRKSTTITIRSEIRQIDSSGLPLTGWLLLEEETFSESSQDPLRYSRKRQLPEDGRYEFQIKRLSESSDDSSVIDAVTLGGLRCYGGAHPAVEGCTCIEAKIRATDQLNGDVASKIRVVCTRRLRPVTATGFGTTASASRSIVDAVAYIATSQNGGMLDDSAVIWDVLSDLRTDLVGAGYNFDWRFTSRGGVMDACQAAAKLGRAVPYMPGGMFCLAQDALQTVPRLSFGGDDFTDGALSVVTSFRTVDSPTCVRCTYINPVTWQAETVVCYDPGGSETMPLDVRLDGCTSRQHAWEIGMYLYRDMMLSTTTAEFSVGLKGRLATMFGATLVAEELIDWGQTGVLARINGSEIWLSEPVDFAGESFGKLYVELADGTPSGPHAVTPGGNAHCVLGAGGGTLPVGVKTLEIDHVMATRYIFGPASINPLTIRVMGIQPQGQAGVTITGQIVDPAIYEHPGGAPAIGEDLDAAWVEPVFITSTGATTYLAYWSGRAATYRVERVVDGVATILADALGVEYLNFSATMLAFSIRVTPYILGVLTPAEARDVTYVALAAPGSVAVNPGILSATVSWAAVTNAQAYEVSVIRSSVVKGAEVTTDLSLEISEEDLRGMGGPWPSFDVAVRAVAGQVQGPQTTAAATLSVISTPAPKDAGRDALAWVSWPAVTGAEFYTVFVAGFNTTAARFASTLQPGDTGTVKVFEGLGTSCAVLDTHVASTQKYLKVWVGADGAVPDGATQWGTLLLTVD